MQDGQEFQINGTVYTIFRFQDYRIGAHKPRMTGWHWSTSTDESELFPTALEALQNAIDNESMASVRRDEKLAQELQDEIYGTYEQQVNNLYYSTRL